MPRRPAGFNPTGFCWGKKYVGRSIGRSAAVVGGWLEVVSGRRAVVLDAEHAGSKENIAARTINRTLFGFTQVL